MVMQNFYALNYYAFHEVVIFRSRHIIFFEKLLTNSIEEKSLRESNTRQSVNKSPEFWKVEVSLLSSQGPATEK
jgi:hypothetical protein